MTTVALIYDFDGTLAPGNMQEHTFLPHLGIDKESFWTEANAMAVAHDMDGILAYMQLMLDKANEKNVSVMRSDFIWFGQGITFFSGVETFFERINAFAANLNLHIDHHVVSSGLREFILGTPIAKNFRNIFASGFKYNEDGVAKWPALAINYTGKTQYLFRINKGIDNSYDNARVNKFMPGSEKPVPFSRMIYIGDGETDVPAMKMVKYQGGATVAVYNPDTLISSTVKNQRQVCLEMIEQKRVDYIAAADYSENSPLFLLIKNLITQIRLKEDLKNFKT